MILGIRKKYRHVRRYGGLSAYLYVEMNRAAHLLGIERASSAGRSRTTPPSTPASA
jgi:hypothetical protein